MPVRFRALCFNRRFHPVSCPATAFKNKAGNQTGLQEQESAGERRGEWRKKRKNYPAAVTGGNGVKEKGDSWKKEEN